MVKTRLLTRRLVLACFALLSGIVAAQEKQGTLIFSPDKSSVQFALGATMHTVEGSFALRSGVVHFTPATNAINGEIIVDSTTGQTGNDRRDKKMHQEVLESGRYPQILFRPERVDGHIATEGVSTVQLHGKFSIHGVEQEVDVPAKVELAGDHWSVDVRFEIPFVNWGMKDPSSFLLHVQKNVTIDFHASGSNPWQR